MNQEVDLSQSEGVVQFASASRSRAIRVVHVNDVTGSARNPAPTLGARFLVIGSRACVGAT